MAMLVFAVTVTITRSIAQRRLKSRVAQLEYERSLENERQRIAREMHDDVGAGLTQIGFLSEGARRHASKQVPIDHELQRISDKVRDLVTSVSEMVWSLNKENNSLESLLVKMREQSAEQLEAAGIDFVAKLPAFIPSNTMSSQTTHNVLMVIKEAINNTIKHSGGSKLTMEIVINNQQLLISLHDNGKGLSTGSPTVGNGIRNMKHRIEEISGKLEMYNDNGLAIKIMIPISSIST
jgi:signal transduction histidine kinase